MELLPRRAVPLAGGDALTAGTAAMPVRHRVPLLWLAFAVLLLSGCAALRNDDRESELPWSKPQPWEGVIPMPGFENR